MPNFGPKKSIKFSGPKKEMMVASCYLFSGGGWGVHSKNLPGKIRPTITRMSSGCFGRVGLEALVNLFQPPRVVRTLCGKGNSVTSGEHEPMAGADEGDGIFLGAGIPPKKLPPKKTPPVLKVGKNVWSPKSNPFKMEGCDGSLSRSRIYYQMGSFERMLALEGWRKDEGQKGHGYMIRITVIWKRF